MLTKVMAIEMVDASKESLFCTIGYKDSTVVPCRSLQVMQQYLPMVGSVVLVFVKVNLFVKVLSMRRVGSADVCHDIDLFCLLLSR